MTASPADEGTSLESVAEAAARTLGVDRLRLFMLGGALHIEGAVPSFRQKKAAAELVGLLAGADRLVNRLRVAPRDVRAGPAVARRIQAALEQEPDVDAATVQLEVGDDVVELLGTVSSLSARCAAERAVWSVGGVASVVNRLRVASTAASADDLARQLEADLCACLSLPVGTARADIVGGTVYLKGIVPSPYQRLAAEDLVRAHEMVHEVVNSLALTTPLQAAPGLPADEHTQERAS